MLKNEDLMTANVGPLDYHRVIYMYYFALLAKEKKITGACAEVGVWRGAFARIINLVFNDRKLYLFDTFEGFDRRDIDIEHSFGRQIKEEEFKDTNEMFVATIMPHKDKVIICKGSFPETAVGLNEEFAFVSIDVDLFQPTLEALRYFYPRLVKGGAIMIHDYNAPAFPGVKQAVMKYSAEQEFVCFPLADDCGSLVILK